MKRNLFAICLGLKHDRRLAMSWRGFNSTSIATFMSMPVAVFNIACGLQAPWSVKKIDLNPTRGRIDFYISFQHDYSFSRLWHVFCVTICEGYCATLTLRCSMDWPWVSARLSRLPRPQLEATEPRAIRSRWLFC